MRLTETFISEQSQLTIDREAGVIRGVRILGDTSDNGYRYLESAMADAARLYNGVRVNIDHRGPTEKRSFSEFSGQLEETRYIPGKRGVYGDLHVLRSHPLSASIFEAAERFPRSFGLSHDAEGEMDGDSVKSVKKVYSVDVVTRPATNRGLFEEFSTEARVVKKTLREILAGTKADAPRRNVLQEMLDGDMADGDMTVEMADESSPEDQIKAGVMAAIMSKLDGADGATLGKVLKALGISDKVSDSMGGGSTEVPEETPAEDSPASDEPKDDEPMPEDVARKIAELEAKTMLLESGRQATAERILAVSLVPADKRLALVESWPINGQRPDGAPPKYTNNNTSQARRAFADRLAKLN